MPIQQKNKIQKKQTNVVFGVPIPRNVSHCMSWHYDDCMSLPYLFVYFYDMVYCVADAEGSDEGKNKVNQILNFVYSLISMNKK